MMDRQGNLMKQTDLKVLNERLEKALPAGEWKKILAVLDITGIADNSQLQSATGLGRDKLRRTLEKMESARVALPPLFLLSTKKLIRPGFSGRAPKVFTLGESGAALRRSLGHKDARHYSQENPIAQAHALAVLDTHLAAKQAGLQILTEQRLHASKNLYIRPDCFVTLEDEHHAIFELEQLARPDYLPRITRSLRQKIDFFSQKKDANISPEIRVLFNLKPGATYRKTLQRWRGVCELLAKDEKSGTLPFSLLAMPLMDFLADPDWGRHPDKKRWTDLSSQKEPSSALGETASAKPLPSKLKALTSQQNLLVLEALWQEFRAQDIQEKEKFVFPDPQFLELIQVIYLASHNPKGTALERAAFPNASLYLLKQYLLMRPDLLSILNSTMAKGGRSIHWNATTILNRIQNIVDAFLAYHGFRSTGTLKAFSQVVDWNAELPKSFMVKVKITAPDLLTTDPENYYPRKEDVHQAEKALSWVLRALFVHAKKIGLYTLPF
jgi:hypothetical protein